MTGRHLTTGITLCCLVVVLVVMAVWGYHSLTQPVPSLSSQQSSKCTKAEISVQRYVHRKDVTVSVFNAGAPSGTAGNTLARLENLGFQPGAVANAPKGVHVKGIVVFTTASHKAGAKLVARVLGKHVRVRPGKHEFGPGVDVFIATGKVHPDKKAPKKLKLAHPIKTCVRVK